MNLTPPSLETSLNEDNPVAPTNNSTPEPPVQSHSITNSPPECPAENLEPKKLHIDVSASKAGSANVEQQSALLQDVTCVQPKEATNPAEAECTDSDDDTSYTVGNMTTAPSAKKERTSTFWETDVLQNFGETEWYLNFRMPEEAFLNLCDLLHPCTPKQTIKTNEQSRAEMPEEEDTEQEHADDEGTLITPEPLDLASSTAEQIREVLVWISVEMAEDQDFKKAIRSMYRFLKPFHQAYALQATDNQNRQPARLLCMRTR
ncbi:hypothetical protein DPX16_1104 [Anabarilius grahami]|uniref:Uncharacterized protein n=1 Tax=Anabarilius grahami TaxID=495550 RepID=A0A3N0YH20_ANAGA|nr:hypothetical protein DPX16_1104 [Anabarilius grahami]